MVKIQGQLNKAPGFKTGIAAMVGAALRLNFYF